MASASTREYQREAEVADLTQALGEAAVKIRVWKKSAEGPAEPFEDLEVIRTEERRDLARDRKAAFAEPPTGPNQVWQPDFTDFETVAGGTWQVAGCRD